MAFDAHWRAAFGKRCAAGRIGVVLSGGNVDTRILGELFGNGRAALPRDEVQVLGRGCRP